MGTFPLFLTTSLNFLFSLTVSWSFRIFLYFFCTFVKSIQPVNILAILKHRGGNLRIGESSLFSSQPLLISSSCWIWVEVSDLLCFYAFSALFVTSILILFCQNTINLLFIIHLEFWAWFSTINASKKPKGRFGPFSHFRPLSQKRPRHLSTLQVCIWLLSFLQNL